MSKKSDVVISVKNLSKFFRVKIKEKGFLNSVKSIFHPKVKNVGAVKNISFDIKKGELVAFIGPNGAGKSTTLKMLSGILYPSNGNISVNNMIPGKDRNILAYKIGTVFGQKPQLWFHLPAIDSFDLFSRIYDMDQKVYKKRINYLINLFDIEDIVTQPVRKLSLGQRMICEFVLALLHKPEIIFLDEPTIGLDLVIKKKIRSLIKKINEEENVTVILTSHDLDDVEKVCKRLIIINDGSIVYDGSVNDVKKKYLNIKILTVQSGQQIKLGIKKGIEVLEKTDFLFRCRVDTKIISVQEVISKLLSNNNVDDINIEDISIEEVIEEIYDLK